MSHQGSPVVRPEKAVCILEGSAEGRLPGNKPNGTYFEYEQKSRTSKRQQLTSRQISLLAH